MIIVEGPDGSGKSTLVKRIREEFSTIRIAQRVVGQNTEAMVDLKGWVEKNLDMGWQWTLFDRHRLISEPIYGSILRAYAQPGFDELTWLYKVTRRFYDIKPIIIYCIPSWQTVEQNMLTTQQPATVFKNSSKIYRAYVAKAATDLVASRQGEFTCWIYDYTQNNVSWLLSDLHRVFQEKMRS